MNIQQEVVTAASGWIGTPYVHQASVKGAGCDCLGLVRGVWREIYGHEPEFVPPYTQDWSEPSRQEVLWAAASRHLAEKPIDRLAAGDLVLFRMRNGAVAKHLGIVSQGPENRLNFIHAYSRHGVVENPLSLPWAKRLAACFEFPNRSI
ncbi:hypothetical protein RB2150_04248 [Rhodobacterales bacterium HTCC2150]|nr:hypothetical protein RB2150_04248 [Rhodobacterales bacterium HTCC2150] [Rhodobacteraceae bacterium HTCC2150]